MSQEVMKVGQMLADYVSWLMFERPTSLSILIHPLTGCQVRDHSHHALWLGEPLPIAFAVLEAADATALATGRSEESIIDGTKAHSANTGSW